MKGLCLALAALLFAEPALRAGDAGWSEPVNGLRARLEVLPPAPNDRWFCRVYLEFQDVADTRNSRRIAFARNCLAVQLTDAAGHPPPSEMQAYDGVEPMPTGDPLILPFDGTLRFQVSGHGLGVPPDAWRIVDMGGPTSWVIRRGDSPRFLGGTLTIPRVRGGHPFVDWSGTLILPRVPVPAE